MADSKEIRITLRMPDTVRDQIAAFAIASNRSMNAEIVARLTEGTETMRDKFAMAALTGLIPAYQAAYGSPTTECMEIAQEAYGFADIMIAARKAGA